MPKEVARLFPDLLLLSLREVRALARPLRDFGALVRPWRRNFSCDFCNCVRARWRWVSLGRGGRGTSTPHRYRAGDGAAFLPHSVETEVKGIFPGAGPWVFRLVSIRSSASLRDRGQLELG